MRDESTHEMVVSAICCRDLLLIFFFNDTATTEIYTLSLHDALPIFVRDGDRVAFFHETFFDYAFARQWITREESIVHFLLRRSEEHTSELQSRQYLVCRLLLEKKKKMHISLVYEFLFQWKVGGAERW